MNPRRVANLTFEVNIILPTYVTTEKVRKSVLPPPLPTTTGIVSQFYILGFKGTPSGLKIGKFNQKLAKTHNIIGNIEFIKRYTQMYTG